VLSGNLSTSIQICQCAGHFQYPEERPGRHIQPLHGIDQKNFIVRVQSTMHSHLRHTKTGVGLASAMPLPDPCQSYLLPDVPTHFRLSTPCYQLLSILLGKGGNTNMKVNPVQ